MSEFLKTSLEYVLHKPISGSRPKGGASIVGEIPSLGGENITMEGGLKLKGVKKISSEYFESMPRGQLRNLDVLINKDGANTGKSTIYRKSPFLNAAVNEHLFILRGKKGKLDQEYLHHLLQFSLIRSILETKITGSAQPGINSAFVKNFHVDLAPFPEQKKIASILTSVDEVIDNTQKQIDKLKDLKNATMNELLTKGIGHTEFKESELGRIPKSWENISVDQALERKILDSIQEGNHGGQHPKSSDYVTDGIPFVMASDLRNGKVDVSRAKKIPTEIYEGLRIGFARVGDILLTHKATIGEVAVVDEDCGDIMCTPQVTYYRIKDAMKLSSRFLFYWFQSQPFQSELFRVSGQSTRDYIGITAQKKLFIRIPPINEQKRITSILVAVDEKVSRVKKKLTQTQSLKKSLMQDLLTGKVRVTVN